MLYPSLFSFVIFMKRLLLLLLVISSFSLGKAQNEPLFIFDQFYNAKVHFKNRSVTVVAMNYDAVNDKMYYKDQERLMELTNANLVDSIVWAGKRTFLPYGHGYFEQIKMENGTAFIHWRIKNVNVGSQGPMGAVTQAKVEAVNIRSMGVYSAENKRINNADVYQQKNANEYYLPMDGKFKKITNKKHILKLYPEHKSEIEAYMDKENIKMQEPLSVLQLLNFCMGLE